MLFLFPWSSSQASYDPEGYRDVAPGGVGVGADLVRPGGERFGLGLAQAGDVHLKFHGEPVSPAVSRADADAGGHLAAGDVEPATAGGQLERGVEAGGVAGREQDLRVGRAARAAHLLRDAQVDVEEAVLAGHVAVAAVARGTGNGGVKN